MATTMEAPTRRGWSGLVPYVALVLATLPIVVLYAWLLYSSFFPRVEGLRPIGAFTLENWRFLWAPETVEQLRAAPSSAPQQERAAPAMEKATRTKLTWVAIQLLDHEDNPVAGEAYELTLPDGAVRSGTLNGDGKAEERGIDPGTCKVRFPGLDADAWEFVESREG